MTTTGVPSPWSNMFVMGGSRAAAATSVPQRLAGLQRMLEAFHRFAFAAQAQDRLALEIEKLLRGHRGGVRAVAAREDPGELPADRRVVIADAPGAPRQVGAELQSGKAALAGHAAGGRRTGRRATS